MSAYGYQPQYYNGYVVYYNSGRPYYYDRGAISWVPAGSPYYAGYVNHWRENGRAYGRWYVGAGYRYHGYRASGYVRR